MNKIPEKHVFVCINCRDNGKKSCGDAGLEIRSKLVQLAALDKGEMRTRINKSGCLDACEQGPTLVIYPEGIWYKNVDISDCNEIYEKSIKSSEIIDRLILKEEDLSNSR